MHAFLGLMGTRLWATSLQTVVLVAVVWLLCRLLPRLPARTQCALWWLVAVQAVLGLVWIAPLELPLLPAPEPAGIPLPVQPATATLAPAAGTAVGVAEVVSSAWSWRHGLLALWLGGMGVMGLHSIRAWRASREQLGHAEPCRDARLVAALQLAAEAHGLRRAPRLMLSGAIDSPQLVGPWRPVLLLPEAAMTRMDDDQLDMALTHELLHLQRRDLWLGLVPALARHLFFFHPLVHLAAREYAITREAAVDAAVVAGNRHCRQHYGRLLLQLGIAPRPGAGLASASPSFLSLKRRLLMLQDTSSFPRLGAGLIVAAVALLGVVPLRLVAGVPSPPPAPAAPPAPPAPAVPAVPGLPKAPPLPPAPAVSAPPPAPDAPKAPPAPAVPPAPSGETGSSLSRLHGPGEQDAFALVGKGQTVLHGSLEDLEAARRHADGKGVLWTRHDGHEYVIRDPATLSRFAALHAEADRLGEAMGRLGEEQGKLGARQGELGARLGELGAREAELAAQQARQAMAAGTGAQAARRAGGQARSEAERVRRELDPDSVQAEMARLAERQRALAREQAALARQQGAAAARALHEARQLIERAISAGTARRISG